MPKLRNSSKGDSNPDRLSRLIVWYSTTELPGVDHRSASRDDVFMRLCMHACVNVVVY